jgi:hypothetical protein
MGKNQITSLLKNNWLITDSCMNNARFFEVVETTRTEGFLILLFSKEPKWDLPIALWGLTNSNVPTTLF